MKYVVIFLFVGLFPACFNSDEKKFTRHPAGFYFRMITIGEEDKKVGDSTVVIVQWKIFNKDKNLIYQRESDTLVVNVKNRYDALFVFLHQGDSVHIIASQYFWMYSSAGIEQLAPDPGDVWLTHLKVKRVMTQGQLAAEQKLMTLPDSEIYEQQLLQQFLKENNITQEHYLFGMYFLPETSPGMKYKKGDTLLLYMRGYLLDGRCFDSTFAENPFEYIVGTKGQLIPGLEKIISSLQYEQIFKIIIPSQLAFQDREIISDLVKPYSTVIYRVKSKLKNNSK